MARFPHILTRGFADDLAFMFEIPTALFEIQSAIDYYCAASGGKVNQRKTLIIPTCADTAYLALLIRISTWPQALIKAKGRYLGFMVGRHLHTSDSYMPALEKFNTRLASYQHLRPRLTVTKRIIISNVFLLSLFSYLNQVYVMPDEILRVIKFDLWRFIIPFRSIPQYALFPNLLPVAQGRPP